MRASILLLCAWMVLNGWSQTLLAGASANKITPTNQVYLAGYASNRPNTGGVHDDIWVRALVLQVGQERIAIAVCDLLGLLRDDVLKIRQQVKSVPSERVIVACTHTHSAPDTIGLWGPPGKSGRDEAYVNFVMETVAKTIEEAVSKLQPAIIGFAKTNIEGVSYNLRIKEILDTEASLLQVRAKADGKPIATLTNFACHPEVLNNDQLTADFCHWYYQEVESRGGGVAIFVNGALGGMISPAPNPDYTGPKGQDWERAERYGKIIATKALEAIANAQFTDTVSLEHFTITYTVALENEQFKQALSAGIIPKGSVLTDGNLTTESHLVRIGSAVLFTMPGEVLPNIGIMLKSLMAPYGDPAFLLGLANDELGYILCPADYYVSLYSYERSMSVGSQIGMAMIQSAKEMMTQLQPIAKSAGREKTAEVERQLNEYLKRFRPERAGQLKVTYRLALEDAGDFYLRIADGKATLSREGSPSEAQVTVKANAQVLLDVITGKRNPLDAYNLGELVVEGDIGLAQYLLYVFE